MKYFAACLFAGTAFAALTTASSAADVAAEPVDIWSGFYAGIQGGYAFGQSDSVSQGGEEDEVDHDGAFGGLYYGRNWQSGDWVFGLDGSLSWANIEGEFEFDVGLGSDIVETNVDFFSASRARVGYAFDNVLLFAAAGASFAHVEGEYIDGGVVDDEDEEWLMGFTVGAGVEAKFTEHLSARLEYMYINYGDDTIDFDDITEPSEIDLDLHIVRAGIAYHF